MRIMHDICNNAINDIQAFVPQIDVECVCDGERQNKKMKKKEEKKC